MRILLIHTKYLQRGGEDAVVEAELKLLKSIFEVDVLYFDNKQLVNQNKLKTAISSIYNSNSARIVSEKIKAFKPDVIHIHNLFYEASPSILYAAKRENIPVVLTLHNFRLICASALLLRENEVCEKCISKTLPLDGIKHKCFQNSSLKTAQLSLQTGLHKITGTWQNNVDRYLVFSDFLKQKFLSSSLNLKSNQISIKPNFVEDRGVGEIDKREDYFLFIGRLSEEKGVRTLLEAFNDSSSKLEIIGGGELETEVKRAAEKENITYWGFQKTDFIIDKLKKAKALVFPSVWYEGMPITILESFSTGTPILISSMNNVKGYVIDKHNGLHFNAGQPEDLKSKINQWESLVSGSFYENARATYLEKYSPEVNLGLLKNIYTNLVSSES